ncbi:hypothetical protein JCM3765_000223 [Sporobolomyces pararoseus]
MGSEKPERELERKKLPLVPGSEGCLLGPEFFKFLSTTRKDKQLTENLHQAPEILPHCQKYPAQASSLFQSYVDLRLAQQWRDLEVIELEEISTVVLRGRPKTPSKAPPAIVLPMNLTTPTSIKSLDSILSAVAKLPAPASTTTTSTNDSTDSSSSSPTIYLAIVEKDSSIVYYVLRQGIVSPKEVPE